MSGGGNRSIGCPGRHDAAPADHVPTPQEQAFSRHLQERFTRLGELVDDLSEQRDAALSLFAAMEAENAHLINRLAEAEARIDALNAELDEARSEVVREVYRVDEASLGLVEP